MIIFDEQKLVLLTLPRVCSTSLRWAYNIPSCEPDWYHASLSKVRIAYPHTKYYSIALFVRNPYDKVLSIYSELKRRKYQYSEEIRVAEPLLSEYGSFEAFVHCLPYSKWFNDVHLQPQIDFLKLGTQYILQDFLGKYETFSKDYEDLCMMCKIPKKEIKHVNKSEHLPWKDCYTLSMKSVVRKLYKLDFEVFDYEI